MDTTFRHGDPVMIDYTPGDGDVAAGDVVVLGDAAGLSVGIAHRDIANNALGALAAGGGVYDAINLNNAANFARVHWNATAKKVTNEADPVNLPFFGFIVAGGGGGANTVCRVLHHPHDVVAPS